MIQDRVVSTMALVLEKFKARVKEQIPDVKFVYDEDLSYETAITKFRADNNIDATTPAVNALPLMAFRRSVLRHSAKGMGRRSATGIVNFSSEFSRANGSGDTYKVVHGEMDIEYLFITKGVEDMERFEIEYLSEMGMTKDKTLTVDLNQDLGLDLPYYIDFGQLSDKRIESGNNYFKAVTGSALITGTYPVFKTTSKLILHIVANIYTSTDLISIPPEHDVINIDA